MKSQSLNAPYHALYFKIAVYIMEKAANLDHVLLTCKINQICCCWQWEEHTCSEASRKPPLPSSFSLSTHVPSVGVPAGLSNFRELPSACSERTGLSTLLLALASLLLYLLLFVWESLWLLVRLFDAESACFRLFFEPPKGSWGSRLLFPLLGRQADLLWSEFLLFWCPEDRDCAAGISVFTVSCFGGLLLLFGTAACTHSDWLSLAWRWWVTWQSCLLSKNQMAYCLTKLKTQEIFPSRDGS